MTDGVFVGVDIGGGGMRARGSIDGVTRKARDRGPVARRDAQIDTEALITRITPLIGQVGPVERPITRLAIGMTGMPGLLEAPGALAADLGLRIAAQSIIVASDALITHVGALHGAAGTVVSAGTGVIVLGTDHRTHWQQADGWGYLLGDQGGGAWIGAAGLNAALRAHDRRPEGSPTLLQKALELHTSVDGIIASVYNLPSPAHEAAKFAPVVADAAREGDEVARRIWADAARQLAQSAHAASTGLPPLFSWGGRLFAAGDILLHPFRDELLRLRPQAELVPPHGQAADGALLLAMQGLRADDPAETRYAREFRVTPALAGNERPEATWQR